MGDNKIKSKTINLEDKKIEKSIYKNINKSKQPKQNAKVISFSISRKKIKLKKIFFENKLGISIIIVILTIYFISYIFKSN